MIEANIGPRAVTSRRATPNGPLGGFLRCAAGAGIIGAAAFGTYAIANDGLEIFENRIDFGIGDDAQPSDDLANTFNSAMRVSALLGGLVLIEQGARQVQFALNPSKRALNDISRKGRSNIANISSLALLGGAIFGFSANIGDAVGGSQVDALRPLVADFSGDTTLLSNSGAPELATTPVISDEVITRLLETKAAGDYSDVDIVPLRYSWDNVIREKDIDPSSDMPAPKILSVVMGLPSEITGLEDANDTCTHIPISASAALGDIGDNVLIAGATFTIDDSLEGSGPNVVPIAMTNESYARCFTNNPSQPYNLVALRGEQAKVEELLDESGLIGTDDPSKRVLSSSLDDFFAETDRTSQNNSNGIILVFAIAASLATGGALVYKTRSEFANNRGVNSMLAAGGMSNGDIRNIAMYKSDREALMSSLVAGGLVVGLDYTTALGTPGAENVSPNVLTLLTILGITTGIGRAAIAISAPSEVNKLNPAQRGVQR